MDSSEGNKAKRASLQNLRSDRASSINVNMFHMLFFVCSFLSISFLFFLELAVSISRECFIAPLRRTSDFSAALTYIWREVGLGAACVPNYASMMAL